MNLVLLLFLSLFLNPMPNLDMGVIDKSFIQSILFIISNIGIISLVRKFYLDKNYKLYLFSIPLIFLMQLVIFPEALAPNSLFIENQIATQNGNLVAFISYFLVCLVTVSNLSLFLLSIPIVEKFKIRFSFFKNNLWIIYTMVFFLINYMYMEFGSYNYFLTLWIFPIRDLFSAFPYFGYLWYELFIVSIICSIVIKDKTIYKKNKTALLLILFLVFEIGFFTFSSISKHKNNDTKSEQISVTLHNKKIIDEDSVTKDIFKENKENSLNIYPENTISYFNLKKASYDKLGIKDTVIGVYRSIEDEQSYSDFKDELGYVIKNNKLFNITTNSFVKNYKADKNIVLYNDNFRVKEELYPLGEKMPLFLDKAFNSIFGINYLNTQKNKNEIFKYKNLSFFPFVCVETHTPFFVSKKNYQTSPDFNVVIFDHFWFENDFYKHTHVIQTVYRSMESNKHLFFAGNNSFSGVISPEGAFSYFKKEGSKTYTVNIKKSTSTPFHILGKWTLLVFLMIILVFNIVIRKSLDN